MVENHITEADLTPLADIPKPQPKATEGTTGPTAEQVAQEPLLAILKEEEIFHDPNVRKFFRELLLGGKAGPSCRDRFSRRRSSAGCGARRTRPEDGHTPGTGSSDP